LEKQFVFHLRNLRNLRFEFAFARFLAQGEKAQTPLLA
jgi:hypothetical protein